VIQTVLILLLSWQAMAAVEPAPTCARVGAELRKGPGPQFPVSWKAPKYMPFLRFESKGGFARVQDMDGEIHWAKVKDLTTKISCVVVKSQTALLKRDPAKTAPAADIKSVDKYTPFKKLEVKVDWIKVEDETGRQSWVHESQIWKPVKVNSISF
jgi:SH3-like domain-containing protein